MTKADLAAFLPEKAKITKKNAEAAIGAFREAVSGALAKGETSHWSVSEPSRKGPVLNASVAIQEPARP